MGREKKNKEAILAELRVGLCQRLVDAAHLIALGQVPRRAELTASG